MRFLVKQGINLPCDPAIPLRGIHPEKATVPKDTCAPMFIAALFTIARTWKQPRCPLTDEWIKKVWCVYTMEYYSPIKKSKLEPFHLVSALSLVLRPHACVPPWKQGAYVSASQEAVQMISPMKGFSTNPPSIATSANAQQVWEHGVTVPTFSKLRTSVHALLEHREKLAGIKTPPTSRRCPRSLADDKRSRLHLKTGLLSSPYLCALQMTSSP